MKERRDQDSYIGVNLKDLFWSVLCHWRLLLAALLVGGVVLGAYKGYKDLRVIHDAGEIEARHRAYETELESYEKQKKMLETDLKNLHDSQDQQQYYQDNALMLQMDQYNVRLITASYCVEIGQQTDVEKEWVISYAQALLRRYQAALGQIDLDKAIATAEQPKLTATNPTGSSRKLLETSTDDRVSVLYVTVRADSEERAAKIYAEIEKTLAEQEAALSVSDGWYRLIKISESRYADVDVEIGKVQTNFENSMKSVADSISEREKSLSALKEPSDSTPTVKSAIRHTIKYGVVGAVAGLLVVAFTVMAFTLLRDRLNSTEEAEKRYCLPVLGTIAGDGKKKTKLDKYLAKRLGFNYCSSAEEAIGFAASNVRFQLKNGTRLLLVGSCSNEKLSELKTQLSSRLEGVEILAAGNVNEDVTAVDALRSETAVVCVEEWMKTPHKEIRRELRTIADSGNRILGIIALK